MTTTKIVIPTLRGTIGDWVFYSSLLSANQIAKLIRPAQKIREAESLDEILQRDLNKRKKAIAKYLLTNESHFFNSIIAGVWDEVPEWIEFKFGNSESLGLSEENLKELKESMGFLVFSGNEKIFAIDGQHRVAGIQIAIQDKKAEASIAEDQYSVIFVAHIDNELGRKRTRKLFSDINKNARKVSEGDTLKIDEEDIYAIVTRRIYANYKFFEGGKIIALTESARMESTDNAHFTNLLGINSINKALKKLHKKAPKTIDCDEVNVQSLLNITTTFLDLIINGIPDFRMFFIEKTLDLKTVRNSNKYILFRPVGFKLLANLYVHYFLKYGNGGRFIEDVNKISFVMPESPLNKILWKNGKMEAKTASQSLAYDIVLYLLRELEEEKVPKLLLKYREVLNDDEVNLPEQVEINN